MKKLEEKIEIMQLCLNGELIQSKGMDRNDWITNENPNFNWENNDYRIKPEPRIIWVNVYDDGELFSHKEKNEAYLLNDFKECKGETVKFIEVMESD